MPVAAAGHPANRAHMYITRAASAGTLGDVRKRGHLICGTNTGLAGFAAPDDKGVWRALTWTSTGRQDDPHRLDRGFNAQWTKGGLLYAPPFR